MELGDHQAAVAGAAPSFVATAPSSSVADSDATDVADDSGLLGMLEAIGSQGSALGTDATSKAVDDLFKNFYTDFTAEPKPAAAPELVLSAADQVKYDEFQEAMKLNGRFNWKKGFGKLWSQLMVTDSALQQEYAAVGKSYQAQREFRARWLQNQYDEWWVKRKSTERTRQGRNVRGRPLSFKKIWEEEGEDEEGLQGALSYVRNCLAKHKQGEVAMDGEPWVQKDTMAGGRIKFFYIWKGVSMDYEKEKSLTRVEQTQTHSSSSSARVAPPSAQADAAPDVRGGGTPAPTDKRKAVSQGQAKAKAKAVKVTGIERKPPHEPPATVTREAAKEAELKKGFKSASLTRKRAKDLLQKSNELTVACTTQPHWMDFGTPAFMKPITDARKAVQQWQASAEFWKAWVVHENFEAYAKKHWSADEILTYVGDIPKLNNHLDKLEKAVGKVYALEKTASNLD